MVSVIVPAFRAERFIVNSLSRLRKVLVDAGYRYEIICVVDGTSVDRTFQVAKNYSKKYPDVKVTGYLTNLGKGHAVRFGMAGVKGDVVGYVDAGNDLNYDGIPLLLEHMKWYSADIVIASKRHPASKVVYPWQRRVLSFCYQMVVRLLFGISVRDTQVGMKFYRREVLEKVLPRVLVKAFAFDIEILAVANYLGFKRIYEAPVELNMKSLMGVSTIASRGFLKTSLQMLWDTIAVFYRLKILDFYNDKNKKRWVTPKYLTLKGK